MQTATESIMRQRQAEIAMRRAWEVIYQKERYLKENLHSATLTEIQSIKLLIEILRFQIASLEYQIFENNKYKGSF